MFFYFGYGSNINLVSLKAKGVVPIASEKAVLHGWKLRFNVQHWFRHEGGVGNIEPSANPDDFVEGMVHTCSDEHLPYLDEVESYGLGYDRIAVKVKTVNGFVTAQTYVGLPGFIDEYCMPTRRYLNIIIKGAESAGLSMPYIEKLRNVAVIEEKNYAAFQPPSGDWPYFTKATLAAQPFYTSLGGYVFDMRNARIELQGIIPLLGGKDMTLFFVKRHDTSNGSETEEGIRVGNISAGAKNYINGYLHEYAKEYAYAGVIDYNA
ncbi:MAG: gamma-glutamylcyclotransferase [Bacteroidetes bacterium]|nr:gamma-glutamylcyclotransferase [Bacteroidota bacterium]